MEISDATNPICVYTLPSYNPILGILRPKIATRPKKKAAYRAQKNAASREIIRRMDEFGETMEQASLVYMEELNNGSCYKTRRASEPLHLKILRPNLFRDLDVHLRAYMCELACHDYIESIDPNLMITYVSINFSPQGLRRGIDSHNSPSGKPFLSYQMNRLNRLVQNHLDRKVANWLILDVAPDTKRKIKLHKAEPLRLHLHGEFLLKRDCYSKEHQGLREAVHELNSPYPNRKWSHAIKIKTELECHRGWTPLGWPRYASRNCARTAAHVGGSDVLYRSSELHKHMVAGWNNTRAGLLRAREEISKPL